MSIVGPAGALHSHMFPGRPVARRDPSVEPALVLANEATPWFVLFVVYGFDVQAPASPSAQKMFTAWSTLRSSRSCWSGASRAPGSALCSVDPRLQRSKPSRSTPPATRTSFWVNAGVWLSGLATLVDRLTGIRQPRPPSVYGCHWKLPFSMLMAEEFAQPASSTYWTIRRDDGQQAPTCSVECRQAAARPARHTIGPRNGHGGIRTSGIPTWLLWRLGPRSRRSHHYWAGRRHSRIIRPTG